MIKMTHPQHGEMHVYLDAEAEANKKNGWTDVPTVQTTQTVETVPVITVPLDETDELDEEEKLSAKYELKFNKPPHWKMKLETIKKALED